MLRRFPFEPMGPITPGPTPVPWYDDSMPRTCRIFIAVPLAVVAGTGCRATPDRTGHADLSERQIESISADISDLLTRQVEAWNAGDVEGFMKGYRQDDDLTFLAGGGVTYGWNATLERYRRRYPDREAMGRLTFSDVHINPIAPDAALVWGRWRVERRDETGGLFTLLLRKRDGAWSIVHDHTSVGETP